MMPGQCGETFVVDLEDFSSMTWGRYDPPQVLMSCDCFEYQACESDGWADSEACSFIEALRSKAHRRVVGYRESEWGAPKRQGAQATAFDGEE